MKTNMWKSVFLGMSLLSTATIGYADNWQTEGHYQVKDGLVRDPKTGLIWMRCSLGQKWDGTSCQGEASRYSWAKAMTMPTGFDFAGYKNWRVPNHHELKSLVYCSSGQLNRLDKYHSQCDGDYDSPAIPQTVFPQTPDGWFWSASPEYDDWFWKFPFTSLGNFSWIVNFGSGLDVPGDRDDTGYVRLVRDEKTPVRPH